MNEKIPKVKKLLFYESMKKGELHSHNYTVWTAQSVRYCQLNETGCKENERVLGDYRYGLCMYECMHR